MQELDTVEVLVEKKEYAKEGVHKGMIGTILDPRKIEGQWLVFFPDPITCADTIGIPIYEEDLKIVVPFDPGPTYAVVVTEKEEYMKFNVHKGMYGAILWGESSNELALMIEFTDDASGKKFKTEILREDLKGYPNE